jgi:integrase
MGQKKKRTDRDGICQRPDGYYISFTDHQGRRKQKKLKGVISLTEARRQRNLELAKVTEAITSGKPAVSAETFSQVIPEYLTFQRARLRPRSYTRVADIVNMHLLPVFGEMKLARIRRADAINYVTARSTVKQIEEPNEKKKKKLFHAPAASTIVKELNCLRHVFNWALQQEIVSENPCDRVKGPKVEAGRLRYLQPTELRAVLSECPAWLQPIAALLSFTGMRRSECLGLRWLDCDCQGGRLLLPQTKNGEGRIVWLNDLALKVLASIPRIGARPTDRVFQGGITPENVSLAFLRACRRAGVANFRLHDLRHTAASWLAMGGADIHLVAELLGHRDLRMAKRYRHLSPTYLQGAARKLDAAFGPELLNLPMLQESPSHDDRTMEHENGYKLTQTAAS